MADNADPKRPTFEERLEAIKRTLEQAAAMRRESDKLFEKRSDETAKIQDQTGERLAALLRIAEDRLGRRSRPDDQQQ
jgi:F0F1-type ATP synthase membrane subunit b/b'